MMDLWLDNFAYRAHVSSLVFILPVLGIALIAWLTITLQVSKLASTNPVDVLMSE